MASNTDNALRDTRGLQVVTKVWYTHLGYGRTKLAVEDMLAGLNGCCAVTMLIHWPRCRDDTASPVPRENVGRCPSAYTVAERCVSIVATTSIIFLPSSFLFVLPLLLVLLLLPLQRRQRQ